MDEHSDGGITGRRQLPDGLAIYELLNAGLRSLEAKVQEINGLNVFPVPDRDTGTNMFQTLRRTLSGASRIRGLPIGPAAASIARSALLAARGNSGVLLAEFLRGFAEAVTQSDPIDGIVFARALERGADAARSAVSKPVEGTILTVMNDAAEAGSTEVGRELSAVLGAAVEAARISLRATPQLLPLLREAGVVDAGAAGFLAILEGMASYVGDHAAAEVEPLESQASKPASDGPAHAPDRQQKTPAYGYCTELLIQGRNLEEKRVRAALGPLGESLLIIGTRETLRVHIHAQDPGSVLSTCQRFGSLSDVSIRDMDEQATAESDDAQATDGSNTNAAPDGQSQLPPGAAAETAVVAVAGGEGFAEIFRSLGAVAVMWNDLVGDPNWGALRRVVGNLPHRGVIVLTDRPELAGRGNVIPSPPGRELVLVESPSMPCAVAALVEWNVAQPLAENVERMVEAASRVKVVEIDRAEVGYTATVDSESIGTDRDPTRLLAAAMEAVQREARLVTVYYARDGEAGRNAEELAGRFQTGLKAAVGKTRVEVLYGGQVAPLFLVSLE